MCLRVYIHLYMICGYECGKGATRRTKDIYIYIYIRGKDAKTIRRVYRFARRQFANWKAFGAKVSPCVFGVRVWALFSIFYFSHLPQTSSSLLNRQRRKATARTNSMCRAAKSAQAQDEKSLPWELETWTITLYIFYEPRWRCDDHRTTNNEDMRMK